MRPKFSPAKIGRAIPAWTAALLAAGALTNIHAQIQSAGELFVNVDATSLAEGPLNSIPNTGTLGGVFAATGAAGDVPVVATVGGTKGIRMDGTDFLQLMTALGGSPITSPAAITGENPTHSIEVWALNPDLGNEETMVSWGHRGGNPDGSNVSFNYGSDFRWGALGHWGSQDMGWSNSGGGPAAGHWHHLVYTYDGTTTRVYSDGVLMNREYLGPGGLVTHPDTSILIGAQTEPDAITVTGGLRFSGTIARVRVHDDALTPEQILNNYNAEKATFIDPVVPPPFVVNPERLTKGPVHRYSFNEAAGDATGLTFVDSVAGANGTVLGEGATFTGTRLVLPGGDSTIQAYGDLPNGLLSSNGVANAGSGGFSFETWFKHTGNQNWGRVFDFGSSGNAVDGTAEVLGPGGGGEGRDYLMYSAQNGTDVNNRRLEVRNEDPDDPDVDHIRTIDNGTSLFNTDTHIVVTWDEASGVLKAYQNGVQVSTVTTPEKMSDINDIDVWLGRSNWTGDSNVQGEYDEVRFYDYVLTAGQTLGNAQAGPNILNDHDVAVTIATQPQSLTVPETSAATFSVGSFGSSPVTIQWYRNGNPIQGATNSTYSISSVAGADDTAVFTAQVSNKVNGQVQSVTSSPATLTVTKPVVTLKNRWSFNETSGTTVADSVGGADGTVVTISGVASFAGGELSLNGVDEYVDLPNGIISSLGSDATFETWIRHESPAVWSRVFDFGISTAGEDASADGLDFLFLASRGGDGFPLFIANFPNGGDVANVGSSALGWLPGEQHQYVVTWSASGNTTRFYVDGVLAGSGVAPQPLSNLAGQDLNNWLGRSQFVNDAYWGGKYNEFRIYAGAMTPSQVQASFASGPDSIGQEAPSLSTRISGNNLVISWPASATGYALESSGALGTGVNWTAVGGAVQNGSNMEVTVPLSTGNRFFRLKKP